MQHPSLDVLKYRAMPEVAAALLARHDEIMEQWRGKVLELLPTADELTMRQLEDHIPSLLKKIASALEADHPQPTNELVAAAPAHGETRFHQHYNLNELLVEYHLLRRVILEQIAEELERDLEVDEVIAVNIGVDIALRRSVVAFAEHQAAELKSEANALTKYLSFLSHDLRGSLNGAVLMIEVLKRELSTETKFSQSIDDLDSMRRSMLDTVATMDRFLHAERLRRGKMPVKLGPVKMKQLLDEIARGFAYQARERSIAVEVQAADDCNDVSDRDLLTLILQNLMSNALKYGRQKVELRATSNDDRGLRLSVIDHGPGISAEKMQMLFKPFTRGETYGQQGVGLGLSIARQAADLLGAKFWAESRPGEGTAFHVELPK